MRYKATIVLDNGVQFTYNGESKWSLKRILREIEKIWPQARAVEVERL